MNGFMIIPGPVQDLDALGRAYDDVVGAESMEKRVGSTTTRVNGLVNRGEIFDAIYLYGPLLELCCRALRRPFKLSSLLARSVHPGAGAQELHHDGSEMIGFILMIDEFRPDNGATRFGIDEELACGPAGSLIVYDASMLHGHSANRTSAPRRSIQGAFIPREGQQALTVDDATRARVGPLARYVLDILEPR